MLNQAARTSLAIDTLRVINVASHSMKYFVFLVDPFVFFLNLYRLGLCLCLNDSMGIKSMLLGCYYDG